MGKADKVAAVKAAVTKGGKAIAGKAKELTEITKLKAQIMSCEDVIRKNYLEIGQKVYEAFEESEGEEENAFSNKIPQASERTESKDATWEMRYKKHCTAIRNAKNAIEDLKGRIAELHQE